MDETPKERTERMLAEERRKVLEHDKVSRANEGKSPFSLRHKMFAALPLVAIVVTLYTFTFSYTKWRRSKMRDMVEDDSKQTVGDFKDAFETEFSHQDTQSEPIDPELIRYDDNKKW